MKQNMTWIAVCILSTLHTLRAAEVTVTSALDDGSEGTLRYYADTVASGSTIFIPSGMAIALNGPITTRYKVGIVGLGDGATLVGGGTTNLITGTIPSYNLTCSLYLGNLTLTNGYAGAGGGAVFRFGNTSYSPLPVHIRDCRIVGNHTTGSGGFVNTSGGTFTFTNCVVSGNTAADGGVFGYNNGAYSSTGVYLASNTVFSSNGALSGGGGCFGKTWDRLHLVDCVLTNNTSTTGGGFAAVRGDWRPGLTTFEGCHFVDNEAGGEGGLISGIYPNVDGALFRNCVIRGNTAPRGSLINGMGKHRFEDCLVEGNVSHTAAGWYSAGLFKTQLTSGGYYNYIFSNCVVRGNANTAGGNAILWSFGGSSAPCSLEAYNTLFDGNTANGTVIASPSGYSTRLENCTFVGNGVAGGNALFYIDGVEPFAMTNTTLYANRSGSTGLLYVNKTGVVDIASCTIVSNTLGTTSSTSGAIFNNKGADGKIRVVNSVVAENRNANGVVRDLYGALSTVQYSAFSCPAGTMDTSTSRFDLTPQQLGFGAFGANETEIILYGYEPLPTLAIERGSVLRNVAGMPPASPTDARGMPRPDPISGIADIGAYEYQPLTWGTSILVR
jgi:hypothetical protein